MTLGGIEGMTTSTAEHQTATPTPDPERITISIKEPS